MTEYSATTTNATNKVTAAATDEDATIAITVNDEPLENGSSATWEDGENTVEITVSKEGATSTTYTVTVTKTEAGGSGGSGETGETGGSGGTGETG